MLLPVVRGSAWCCHVAGGTVLGGRDEADRALSDLRPAAKTAKEPRTITAPPNDAKEFLIFALFIEKLSPTGYAPNQKSKKLSWQLWHIINRKHGPAEHQVGSGYFPPITNHHHSR
ncbi:hypothetical protein [Azospirillum lipoferum]|uniref:hypothetical protein n=1 Tax=Azospirillum lipoferum TaxID=193 RepID=UPI0013962385|nr:hypothetical protein [Azospirillum lipoferum]